MTIHHVSLSWVGCISLQKETLKSFTSICTLAFPIAISASVPPALFQLVSTQPSSGANITACSKHYPPRYPAAATQIDDKFQRLDNCQLLLSEELLKEENGEQLFSEDFEEAESYQDRYLENCFKTENRLQENIG
ncbi:hypothetical protein TNCV_1787171 [Trichonephila clavipes]|nr:hypothetical protein TNCV_1787171 [Trichonephila clavipes]